MSKMMAIMVIIIISMTPQAQWKEECHKLRWLKEQYLLLYYQVEILTRDHFLRRWCNTAKYAKYGNWGAYLGAPNMVKWGIPEKILQNKAETR